MPLGLTTSPGAQLAPAPWTDLAWGLKFRVGGSRQGPEIGCAPRSRPRCFLTICLRLWQLAQSVWFLTAYGTLALNSTKQHQACSLAQPTAACRSASSSSASMLEVLAIGLVNHGHKSEASCRWVANLICKSRYRQMGLQATKVKGKQCFYGNSRAH